MFSQTDDINAQDGNDAYADFRVGAFVACCTRKLVLVTLDFGSARLSDKTGGRWTTSGYVETFSEGRQKFGIESLIIGGSFERRIVNGVKGPWEGSVGSPLFDMVFKGELNLEAEVGLLFGGEAGVDVDDLIEEVTGTTK